MKKSLCFVIVLLVSTQISIAQVIYTNSDLQSCIYFYKLRIVDPALRTVDFVVTKKLILTK